MPNPFINVYKTKGSPGSMGKVRAKTGMNTNYGLITAISGNFLYVGSGNSEGRFKLNASDAFLNIGVAYTQATGLSAFPTGVDCVVIGHDSQFPKPEPSGAVNFTTYLKNGGSVPQSYDIGG